MNIDLVIYLWLWLIPVIAYMIVISELMLYANSAILWTTLSVVMFCGYMPVSVGSTPSLRWNFGSQSPNRSVVPATFYNWRYGRFSMGKGLCMNSNSFYPLCWTKNVIFVCFPLTANLINEQRLRSMNSSLRVYENPSPPLFRSKSLCNLRINLMHLRLDLNHFDLNLKYTGDRDNIWNG